MDNENGELCIYYEENAHYGECGDMVLAMCGRNEKPCIMSDGGLCAWYTTEDDLGEEK